VATDYYGVLGISPDATGEEIKRAYRRLARELHPDVNPDPTAQERFKEITRAYEVLSDPEKRRIVDLGGDPYATAADGAGPFGGFGGLGDIMDAFFGGGAGAAGRAGPRSRVRPGADALIRLDLELAEAAFGVTKEIAVDTAVVCEQCTGAGTAAGTHPERCDTCGGVGQVQSVQRTFLGQVVTARTCPTCGGVGQTIPHRCASCAGEGRVRSRRTISVRIPAGVEDGMRIRLAGQGEVGPGGGPAGDLYVEVREVPHDIFTRDGVTLYCRVSLPMTAAALGTTLTVATLDGDEDLVVKPGTQSGTELRLRARGVPHLRGVGRGDLVVQLEVRTPTRLDAEQERLLKELARLRGEDLPQVARNGNGGLFSRVRDAFNGR
jgi:molecular chaperone DnaJ